MAKHGLIEFKGKRYARGGCLAENCGYMFQNEVRKTKDRLRTHTAETGHPTHCEIIESSTFRPVPTRDNTERVDG